MKKIVPFLLITLVFIGIFSIYWFQEIQYLLPTPVPKNFEFVELNQKIDLENEKIGAKAFIHFFNSECPCSRFNLTHFNALVKKYHQKIKFYAVIENAENEQDLVQMGRDIAPQAQLLLDLDKKLAKKLGVYSSPQAVILNNFVLFYRGNYNRNRYCTDNNTNFAQMALDSLLAGKNQISIAPKALDAYGCQLPKLEEKHESDRK